MKQIFLLILAFICSIQLSAQEIIPGEVLIKFEKNVEPELFLKHFQDKHKALGTWRIKKAVAPDWNIYVAEFSAKSVLPETAIDLLKEEKEIRAAETNFITKERDTEPNDNRYEEQWNLDKLEIERVWDITTGGLTADGREIVAMILDSGFDVNHSELQGNLWENPAEIAGDGIDNDGNGLSDDIHGWNYSADSPEFTYQSNHGMGVAGIVGAKGNNNNGIAGINWDIKMMLFQGPAYTDIIAAYYYAYTQRKLYNETDGAEGAFVVTSNASLGFNDPCSERQMWNEALDSTGMVGILNVGATVNADLNIDIVGDTPTGCDSDFIVSVTNTDLSDIKVVGAGYGAETIDIGAPAGRSGGTRVFTLNPEETYNNNFGGCSAASPHVAGVIALMYALPCPDIVDMALNEPAKAARLMKRAIMEGAEPNESLEDITVSEGRLNAYRSMLWWKIYCENPTEERIDVDGIVNIINAGTNIISIGYDPASETAQINYSVAEFREFEYIVSDALGRVLLKGTELAEPFSTQTFDIDTYRLADGAYFVSIIEGKDLKTGSFIIAR